MSALILYVAVTIALIVSWRRFVQPMTHAAALVLILLPLCFIGRALLTGRVYAPVDLPFMSEPLNAYAHQYGVEKVHNGTLSDLYCQVIPWRKAVRYAYAHGQWPLLNPFMLCGDILAAAAQPAPYDPFNLVGLLIPLASSLTFAAAITFFLAGLAAFAFARAIGCRELAAFIAAAGWMFSGNIAFFVGWPLAGSWIYLPLILYAVRLVVREPRLRSGVILTISLVLLILAGHPESLLHVTMVGAAYGIFEMVTTRDRVLRVVAVAVAAGVLALLITAMYLLPFLEAAPQTVEDQTRKGMYAHAPLPYRPDAIRRRAGNTFLPFYGGQPWRGDVTSDWDPLTARTGSVVIALALTAFVLARRRRETWFFGGLALVCLCAAFAAPPIANLLHALPLFNVALNERLAFAASFALVILAALAVDEWQTQLPNAEDERLTGRVAVVIEVVAIVLGIAAIMAWPAQKKLGISTDLVQTIEAVELLPLAIIIVLLAIRTRARIAIPIIFALILGQRVIEDGSIYPAISQQAFYPEIPIFKAIPKNTTEPFRVAGEHFVLIPDSAALYEIEDPRGYEAMTFQRLVETYPIWSVPQPVSFNIIGDLRPPFLSLLNVRYAIVPLAVPAPDGWKQLMSDRSAKLLENMRVLPRAFIPRRVRYRGDNTAILSAIREATDFSDIAWLLVPEYKPHEIANGPGLLTIRRDGQGLDIDARMDRDGWVVVSQTAWRGWRAYLDGKRVETRFANHAFLGVFVPAGRHRLKLEYLPESFTRGRSISFATLGFLIAFGAARSARRRLQQPRAVRA